jgi:hypothetical protein
MKIGISAINKFYRTSAINGIIRFIEMLSPIKFSLIPACIWGHRYNGDLSDDY